MRTVLLFAIVATNAGCRDKVGSRADPTFASCQIEDRVIDAYIGCRRAKVDPVFKASAIEQYKGDVRTNRARHVGEHPHTVERMCAFNVDRVRTNMAEEGCSFALSSADRAVLAETRARVTPPAVGSTPEATRVLAEHALRRDRTCACLDERCVEAARHDADLVPLEILQHESQAVHDNFEQIVSETYDCEIRPEILSPDRWRDVR